MTYLRQGDPRWSAFKLGTGTSTIGASGCLITCLCEAARRFGTDPVLDPGELNRRGKLANAFRGSSAIIPTLAPCAGLEAPRAWRVMNADGDGALRAAIVGALESDRLAILHVNHDADEAGDHFVLGLKLEGDVVRFADPSSGLEGRINLVTLEGVAPHREAANILARAWNEAITKAGRDSALMRPVRPEIPYRVVSVIPINA